MNHALEIITSQQFMLGVLVGLVVGVFFMIYQAYWRIEYLYQCFKMQTPFKLGSDFYYLVTEHTYNQQKLESLKDITFE